MYDFTSRKKESEPDAIAIEIRNREIADIVTNISPSLSKLDFETELHGNFFLIGYPRPGHFRLLTPANIKESWDHIDNGPNIRLKKIFRLPEAKGA